MRLHMQAIHFDADPKLFGFIQQKLSKLETFYDRITSGEVFLKLDKNENTKIHSKLLEVKLYVPGGTMFVREQGSTFEEATDLAVESLKMQVKKFKSKRTQTRPKTGLPDTLAQGEDEELED